VYSANNIIRIRGIKISSTLSQHVAKLNFSSPSIPCIFSNSLRTPGTSMFSHTNAHKAPIKQYDFSASFLMYQVFNVPS
jgi:hypothetical protein